jgi:hypothetical protein
VSTPTANLPSDVPRATSAAPPEEPIVAEVVPPPPSPWRFGLRAMFALMFVCSVQFAAMNYLGVLWGLLAGMFVCFIAFSAVVLAGMVMTGNRTQLLAHMDTLVVRLMLAIVVLFLGSILAGGGTAAWQVYGRIRRERDVEQRLGFTLTQVQVVRDSHVEAALQITSVEDGGVAHAAGLAKDEVILVDGTMDEFITRLHESRGKDVDVNIATGALAKPVQNCPQRPVTLSVPK